ncbi:MAG: UTP--glucose-1-phosphate uridylyltransferase [Desulfobacteraceae bacterium 4572_130]|nr:MAG: UTP--glucose-1-phosphate uridylyltransferase [Desulfobacteraceae bacterium 4572_130]
MKIRKAVFPVAGLGVRFIPATKFMPKEMLPIVDKPIVQYAVEEAFDAGIEEIIFVNSERKKGLEKHFKNDPELEKFLKDKGKHDLLKQVKEIVPKHGKIKFVIQDQPLGLGHAIWCAKDIVGNEPFAVILADDVIQNKVSALSQMVEQFNEFKSSIIAAMEVEKNQTNKYGILDFKDKGTDIFKIKGMVEKPSPDKAPSNFAVVGRYILTPEIFDFLEKKKIGAGGEIQLTDAIAELLDIQSVYGYKFKGTRFDCGDKAGYQMANLAFTMERPELKDKMLKFIKKIIDQ